MQETGGVVAAASYEARKYGVRSAMASKTALKKCPHLIFVSSRFDVYRSVSRQIMDIFLEYTDQVEPLSLDEAFLDVTVNHKNIRSAIQIAREIKARIKEVTGLTASAGVSVNKFLAKIASDYQKPDGLFVILEKDAEAFVETLSIEQFYGVGKVTSEKMHRLGIHTGADLKARSESELTRLFGKAGHIYYNNARGIDNRLVTPDHIRKSLGSENTFLKDLNTLPELREELEDIAQTVWQRIKDKRFQGRTVTLKVKYADFEQITRSKTLIDFITDYELFHRISIELLEQVDFTTKPVRLMGLTISNPIKESISQTKYIQLELDFKD